MSITRRIGDPPHQRGSLTGATCPDIFELSDGNFAVIGTEMAEAVRQQLLPDCRCTRHRCIVIITRLTLIRAKRDIPNQ
ncbi:hypothetical protein [Streptomyces sp. BA2]|uniref:hypothetical protein n=1 Tax=Streptomyces sp. BA2 TaxID=436595 RepID=UPI001F47DD91|nr:hypothetical protein [Streptomyces sp. BA2]